MMRTERINAILSFSIRLNNYKQRTNQINEYRIKNKQIFIDNFNHNDYQSNNKQSNKNWIIFFVAYPFPDFDFSV